MGMGGGGSAPQVIHPGEAAQAAMGTAAAGEQMAIANQPVEQYAQLYTTEQLGPAQMRTQQALANQAAYQAAAAQQDIQSRVDPLAYAERQMRLKAATDRLGQLIGTPSSDYAYRDPRAFQVADMGNVAPLSDLARTAQGFASNLSVGSVNKKGANPRLITATPSNPQLLPSPPSYF